MDSEPLFDVMRPRWTVVARVCSARLGRDYTGDYVQQVSVGRRVNSRVATVLRDLGMMKEQISRLKASIRRQAVPA